jgi:hypothetical protein
MPVQSCCTPHRSSTQVRHAAARCPHCRCHQAARRPAGHGPALSRSSCCHKTTAQAAAFTATHRSTPAPRDVSAVPLPAARQTGLLGPPVAHFSSAWGERQPPPTDRVITLQHFLI